MFKSDISSCEISPDAVAVMSERLQYERALRHDDDVVNDRSTRLDELPEMAAAANNDGRQQVDRPSPPSPALLDLSRIPVIVNNLELL